MTHIPPAEVRGYSIESEQQFLLYKPAAITARSLLVLSLHGYGSNPWDMLRFTAGAVGPEHLIAALRGPHPFYAGAPAADSTAAYNWGVREHWEQAVRQHHAMVLETSRRLGEEFAISPERTVLLGFSQPVGLNYRLIGTHPARFGGVIGICGGLPGDWEEPRYRPTGASFLHISCDADEFYPVPVANQFATRLRPRAATVEFHMIPGGHRFPSKTGSIVQPWLQRVFSSPAR